MGGGGGGQGAPNPNAGKIREPPETNSPAGATPLHRGRTGHPQVRVGDEQNAIAKKKCAQSRDCDKSRKKSGPPSPRPLRIDAAGVCDGEPRGGGGREAGPALSPAVRSGVPPSYPPSAAWAVVQRTRVRDVAAASGARSDPRRLRCSSGPGRVKRSAFGTGRPKTSGHDTCLGGGGEGGTGSVGQPRGHPALGRDLVTVQRHGGMGQGRIGTGGGTPRV